MTSADSLCLHRVPELLGSRVLGVLPALLRDPLSVYGQAASLGDMVRLRLPVGSAYFVSSPALIQEVMQKHASIFQRPPALRRVLHSLTGDNLMTREGDAWRSRRRLLTPCLQRAAMHGLAEHILGAIDASLDRWPQTEGAVFGLRERLETLTQEVVSRTLLGVSLQARPALAADFATVTDYICYRATTPLAPPLWLPTARNRRVRRARSRVDEVTRQILIERRRAAPTHSDLVSILLQARDTQTGEQLDDEQVRRELQIMIGAGESTTSEALTFCFSLLGSHPDVRARVEHELDQALGDRCISLGDLPRLPLLRQVIDETLRLYPPSYVLARATTEPMRLTGVLLRAGTVVLYSPYTLHRDARFWQRPLEFRPERFAPDGEATHAPRYAYLPFGAGPRRCIGEHLAQLEMMFAVARILQRFALTLPNDPTPRLKAGFALALESELMIQVAARAGGSPRPATIEPAPAR